MILYTPLPKESIFPEEIDGKKNEKTIPLDNGVVVLQEDKDNQTWYVVRLISSDPNDYLNASYQPGAQWTSSFSIS